MKPEISKIYLFNGYDVKDPVLVQCTSLQDIGHDPGLQGLGFSLVDNMFCGCVDIYQYRILREASPIEEKLFLLKKIR